MYQYKGNHIEINNHSHDFAFDIRTVVEYNGNYIVLVAIPHDRDDINNLYCLNGEANIVWQSEDLDKLDINCGRKNLAYENLLGVSDGLIYVSDFWGRKYKINPETGKVKKHITSGRVW